MAIKKSEIYRDLWKSCDDLRGPMDPSQYKDYILAILFVKYVSDKYAGKKNVLVEIPKGGGFQDMIALKGKPEIGEEMNKIIAKLAEANGLKGIIDNADFNDSDKLGKGKDMQDRLSSLIATFQNKSLDFSKNKAEGDDILGDAFEYLMRNFARDSGKSKGQFYTPAEVSLVIAKIIGVNNVKQKGQTVYDPTCGSGSLLLKVSYETPHGITIYGQENDVATRTMAIMNMWLHENQDAIIERENTLTNPQFKNKDGTLKTFDFAVANPPFSTKSWSLGLDPENDEYKRFDGYGIPPKKNGDYAFLLHLIKSLKPTGKGAIILPHGVLFRGGTEEDIRKNKGMSEEVIEGNIRKLITEEKLTDPKFYGNMSAVLEEIIIARKNGTIEYAIYLKKISELTKKLKNPLSDTTYPKSINTKPRMAFYNNLNSNEELAVKIDEAIIKNKPDAWKGHPIKEKRVKIAIEETLKQQNIEDDSLSKMILVLAIEQKEY